MKQNMKIRCVAVDDEPIALEKIVSYVNKLPYLELVAACSCANEAMVVMSEKEVDAIFIDINMPDMNGMDFIKSLPSPPMVVFTTAYAEYAVDSYKVRAVDYLLKPFSFADFQRASEYLRMQFEQKEPAMLGITENESLFLKVDYRYVRVVMNDIVYIEGMSEYLKFHLASGDPVLVHITFKQLSDYLPEHFCQVHRSYMVNINHVSEIERSVILMSDGKRISISDGNRDAFMAYLNKRTVKR